MTADITGFPLTSVPTRGDGHISRLDSFIVGAVYSCCSTCVINAGEIVYHPDGSGVSEPPQVKVRGFMMEAVGNIK